MSIFEKACRDTFNLPVWKYLVGTIGSFVSVLLFCRNFFECTIGWSVVVGLGGIIFLFVIAYLYFLCNEIIYRRFYDQSARFDSALERVLVNLHNIYAEIRELLRCDNADDVAKIKTLTKLCDEVKRIFDRKTGAQCSVSIKVLHHSKEQHVPITKTTVSEYTVENICRDTAHSSRDSKKYIGVEHTLIGNTPYLVVINKLCNNSSKPVYINNDIDKAISSNNYRNTSNYLNTSIGVHIENGLPYKSELVYPIIPAKCSTENSHISYMMGFLCIDCNEPNKFNKCNSDILLVQDVADAIYDVIKLLNNK